MTDTSAAKLPLTIAILSSQCLVWYGMQKILESRASLPIVVHPSSGSLTELFRTDRRPDVFILDMETERDAVGTIKQIRESASTSKVVLLCGFEDKDRMREAFASGADGIILKVQPPTVVLAVIDALYVPTKVQAHGERKSVEGLPLGTFPAKGVEAGTPQPTWPEALTDRESEIIRLVEQGLSNKDIASQLAISDSTVRHHMTNIFDKVGVPNRQKLLVHAQHVRSTHWSRL